MFSAMFDEKLKELIIDSIDNYLKNSVDRLPFSDWFETIDSKLHFFRNRTVQGGNFYPLLTSLKKK